MYAVGIVNLGNYGCIVPLGNEGLQKLHNKTERGWKSETQTMHKCVDEVYVVGEFTQEMCNMNQHKLCEYVWKIGKRIW